MKVYEGHVIYEPVRDGIEEALSSPEEVSNYLTDAFNTYPLQEQFYVIPLNRKNYPLGRFLVTLGTATSALVHPREVFRPAILSGASSVVVAHNHPSGDPAPSRADISITHRLNEASRILDISLTDHIVMGSKKVDPNNLGYYSFADAGLV